jgi:hypothetical protein
MIYNNGQLNDIDCSVLNKIAKDKNKIAYDSESNTVTIDKEVFVEMMRIITNVTRVKLKSEFNSKEVIEEINKWILDNYQSEYTALVEIRGNYYICIKSIKYLDDILKQLGYDISGTKLLQGLLDEEYIHDKGRYQYNLSLYKQDLIGANFTRVVVFTSTNKLVNEYRSLCKSNGINIYTKKKLLM